MLRNKLQVPALSSHTCPRARITRHLGADREARLILVSAPAGFGKSTALAGWCHSLALEGAVAVAWITLDEADNNPERFVDYLEAACEAFGCAAASDAGGERGLIEPQARLSRLVGILAGVEQRMALVLDGYEVINSPAVHALVAALIEHGPRNLCVALGTRAAPPLGIARLRGRNQLLELGQAELRFTAPEADACVATLCAGLPPAFQPLLRQAEGWPTAIQLLGHAAAMSADERQLAAAETALSYIFEYFAEEVFAPLPEQIQQFLMRTAVLERMCDGLCAAVLGSTVAGPLASMSLEQLAQAHLFVVPLDGAGLWFRYHHLFRAFLRARLEREAPHTVVGLHQRASAWLGERQMVASAVEHAVAAGDLRRARALLHGLGTPLPARSGGPIGAGAQPISLPAQVVAAACEGLVETLSDREMQVLRLVADGAANQEIAAAMTISIGTVKSHVNHILGKLAAHNRTAAVARARALGLLG